MGTVQALGRLLIAGAVGSSFLTVGMTTAHGDPSGTPPAEARAATPPKAQAGQWIQVDPKTGARTAGRAADTTAVTVDPAFSTSHTGLVQEPAPGGGMMMNLQGRFRSAARATIGPDGTPSVDCLAPGVHGGKE